MSFWCTITTMLSCLSRPLFTTHDAPDVVEEQKENVEEQKDNEDINDILLR